MRHDLQHGRDDPLGAQARTLAGQHGISVHAVPRATLDRMLDGDENLTSVALDAGFSSHAHFSFAFRTEFGRTPSDVRDTLRGRRSSASG